MIKIAVCEDNEIERSILFKLVDSLIKERGLLSQIYDFSSGEEFVQGFKSGHYDIVFLDIVMEQMNGIETGKAIREMDKHTEIIYCTLSSDFAIEAYEVHAMGYLLKPYEPSRIGALLDYYLQKHKENTLEFLKVKSKKMTYVIFWKEILYLESNNKVVTIHTLHQGCIRIYNKLDYFEKELQDSRFLRCHQSYLVNMQHILRYEQNDFVMEDTQIVPIRKSGRKEILGRYEEYCILFAQRQQIP